jgi:transcription-repair coupling factor (superfamily II helicase)
VPTTILAQQHYNTFTQRMKDFPVRIDLLCRFRTPAEQKKTLAEFSKGLVDIIIGTHRVLSKDIRPKNLGLLVVDEEQRFGVTHKEKLKEAEGKRGRADAHGNAHSADAHMSLWRDPRPKRSGGTAA